VPPRTPAYLCAAKGSNNTPNERHARGPARSRQKATGGPILWRLRQIKTLRVCLATRHALRSH
jgi:hypothetical protein